MNTESAKLSTESQKYDRELREAMERDACTAYFTVSHPTLSTEKISDLLDLEPDYSLNDGDTVYESERHHIQQTGSHWRYERFESGSRISADELLSQLLDDLSGKLPTIRRLQSDGAKMSVNVHFDLTSNVSFLELPPDLLTQLFQLRIPVRVMTVRARR